MVGSAKIVWKSAEQTVVDTIHVVVLEGEEAAIRLVAIDSANLAQSRFAVAVIGRVSVNDQVFTSYEFLQDEGSRRNTGRRVELIIGGAIFRQRGSLQRRPEIECQRQEAERLGRRHGERI